jgi:hypothetical protein
MGEEFAPHVKASLERFAARTAVERPTAHHERTWGLLLERSRRPRRARWFALGAIAAVTAALLIAVRVRPEPVRASTGARWQQHDDVVQLSLGQLRLQPRDHVRVVTPHLEVDLFNARALVDVTDGQTVLAAEEGEIVYRTARGEWHLKAGERVVISGAPDAVSVAAPVKIATCGDADAACLGRVAQGSGLAAEMALYKLGVAARERGSLDEAVRLLREYRARFPVGTFAPEASVALMLTLQAAGEPVAAAAEADDFATRFPREPRVSKVRAWRTQLLEVVP